MKKTGIIVILAMHIVAPVQAGESFDAIKETLGVKKTEPGRFQLVLGSGTTYLIDTMTGRVWIAAPAQDKRSTCGGLAACFHEFDRLRLTESGWTSEIRPVGR